MSPEEVRQRLREIVEAARERLRDGGNSAPRDRASVPRAPRHWSEVDEADEDEDEPCPK